MAPTREARVPVGSLHFRWVDCHLWPGGLVMRLMWSAPRPSVPVGWMPMIVLYPRRVVSVYPGVALVWRRFDDSTEEVP